jgi:choline-sulfatase
MEHKTYADTFNAAGYVTAIIGKMHFQGQGEERTHGFYRPYGDGGSEVTWTKPDGYLESRLPEDAIVSTWPIEDEQDTGVTNHSLEFLEQFKDKKFFLISSFRKPHFPFTIHQQYYDLYKDTADLPPTVTQQMLDDLPPSSQNERAKYGFANLTDEQIKNARAHYYGMTTYIDDQVQALLDKLDDLGIRENTIIIYTSDHGDMLGEHGLWYKNCFYEASAGIPFIWSFPAQLPSEKTIDAPAMNMDIFPTLCDLCGINPPGDLQGKSLLPLIKGTEDGSQRIALSENYRGGDPGKMVRTDKWKYCYFVSGKEQLFDMQNDPVEVNNLIDAPQHASLIQQLKAKALENWNYMGYYDS